MSTQIMTQETLISELDASVRLGDPEKIAVRIQNLLTDSFKDGALKLDPCLTKPCPDGYARRLLHRSESLGYTVVVMTWGPGQGTPLHDHAGIWCVEGVAEGKMRVDRYDLVQRENDLLQFEHQESMAAGVGSCGSLIPPFEYHVLSNAFDDQPSVTLHVYGGEMDHCCIYQPTEKEGWFKAIKKPLSYNEE